MKQPPCDLKSCLLCTGCLPEWVAAIGTTRKTVQLKKGAVLFKEGDPVLGIYFVNRGKIKVHKRWGADKELIVRIAGNGAILGHRGLGKHPQYPISATALEPSAVCYIDLNFFRATLKVNHDFTAQLLQFFAEELQESEENMRNLAHMTVKGRLAHTLLALEEKFGTTPEGDINVALSRQDLASMAGSTYETVFRMMTEMADDNILKTTGKQIFLINKPALFLLTNED